jgi:hypothetical protein
MCRSSTAGRSVTAWLRQMAAALSLALIALLGLLLATRLFRPLGPRDVATLAQRRRQRAILGHFSWRRAQADVDASFKSEMAADGRFYRVQEWLEEFPALAAGLLKYKKHEWIIFAFARGAQIELVWTNKGSDRESVTAFLPIDEVRATAERDGYDSILVFHNHPNSDPHSLDCTRPSSVDLDSAQARASVFTSAGLNLLEFVCERGRHHQYHMSVADAFMPLSEFVAQVEAHNGRSRLGNLALHWERITAGPPPVQQGPQVASQPASVPPGLTASGPAHAERLADFGEYEGLATRLGIAITAARERGEPLEHVLLYGPNASDSRRLARAIANEMDTQCMLATARGIPQGPDLIRLFAKLPDGGLLTVEGIDRLSAETAHALAVAAETGHVGITFAGRPLDYRVQPFTLVGIASGAAAVPWQLRDTFGIACEVRGNRRH